MEFLFGHPKTNRSCQLGKNNKKEKISIKITIIKIFDSSIRLTLILPNIIILRHDFKVILTSKTEIAVWHFRAKSG